MPKPTQGEKSVGAPDWHVHVNDPSVRAHVRMMTLVMDSAPGLMAYWNRDLYCLFSNSAYADWFGRSRAEMVGMRYETLLGPVQAAVNRPFVLGVLAGTPQQFAQDLPRVNRGLVPTLTHYVPDFLDGAVVGFTAHVTDISLLKDTERALREEAEERQRANRLIRTSVEALEEAQRLGQIGSWAWTVDPDAVRWSKELYRIMGRDPTLPAPTFAQHATIYAPESWLRLQQLVDIALSTGAPYWTKLEYLRPDGAQGWLEARGEVVRDHGGRIIGLRGTVQNITADFATA